MDVKKILFISQEIEPYVPERRLSQIGRLLPQGIKEQGIEERTFMPKYGMIAERSNQLHEMIRLSGMNVIIDDTDHPLIKANIKDAKAEVVSQLIDLALLQNGLLKGEALNKFVKRSIELI